MKRALDFFDVKPKPRNSDKLFKTNRIPLLGEIFLQGYLRNKSLNLK